MKRTLSIVLALVLLFTFSGMAGAAGNGTVDPYSMSLQALQAKDGVTDLYVNVAPQLSGFSAPDTLKKVQLKSYDLDGKLAYTRNYNGGVESPNGQADIKLTDVKRYQPLNTEVLVQNGQTKSTKVLSAETTVQFRPDLTVDLITAPPEVHVNQSFAVSTVIKELNGDVGAATEVQILHGSTVLDTAEGVVVNAGEQQSVNYMLTLTQVGQYTITVKASDVSPGDYDSSNNEKTFTVEVIEPNKPLNYWSQYSYVEDYNSHYQYDYYYGYSHYSYTYEDFYVSTWTTDKFDPASLGITLTSESGNQVNVQIPTIYNYYYGGDYTYFTGYEPTTNAYVWGYSSPWGTSTYAGTYSGYYSYNWKDYWGGYNYSDSGSWGGSLLGAKSAVDVNLDILANDGTHYGGNYNIALTPYSYSWDYWYSDYWYWYNVHYWGNYSQYTGYSSGVTTW